MFIYTSRDINVLLIRKYLERVFEAEEKEKQEEQLKEKTPSSERKEMENNKKTFAIFVRSFEKDTASSQHTTNTSNNNMIASSSSTSASHPSSSDTPAGYREVYQTLGADLTLDWLEEYMWARMNKNNATTDTKMNIDTQPQKRKRLVLYYTIVGSEAEEALSHKIRAHKTIPKTLSSSNATQSTPTTAQASTTVATTPTSVTSAPYTSVSTDVPGTAEEVVSNQDRQTSSLVVSLEQMS